ncbi:OmpA family protein [Parasulfitobacter algicola]|uniref:OmpA family protein n=1 Tax=Parasulfitobacter algicola TaxID=2614809 RepID=A0ABX2IYG1_9RHOB|nr:OmpA family protein [Sulfitobacter algicola]NSX56197.1 OmpA family protein [Sulfitobacter algicola]
MRLSSLFLVLGVFAVAALAAVFTAARGASYIEQRSEIDVRQVLDTEGFEWTEVESSGLQVILTGEAPDEATRFSALSTVGTVVDAARIMDEMEVARSSPPQAPRFSIEILRNETGVSLIGLIPSAQDRDALVDQVEDAADGADVTDLLEIADYPVPEGWINAVNYGLDALEIFERSKVSIAANRVAVFAAAESTSDKARIEARLSRDAPDGIILALDITAPRPVIAPFTLRFVIDEDGHRFDACAADTVQTRDAIVSAAVKAGMEGKIDCVLGLGMPSPRWSEATAMGIQAVADLGLASITFADTDVTLIADAGVTQAVFDRVAGALDSDLPPAFSLHAIKPEPEGGPQAQAAPEFVATLSPEGLVQLRGRLPNELLRTATESYATSRFGRTNVHMGVRIDETLPTGWSDRVLAGLEALVEVNNGAVIIQEDLVEIRGNTGNPDSRARISRLLAAKLGEAENYTIDVTYQEALDPVASLLDPEECVAEINGIQDIKKITFEPSSSTIDEDGLKTMEQIAEVLANCQATRIEIGGHTDSQGREEMNARLSRERAEAVRSELVALRTPPNRLVAKGYGEAQPIADNDTEAGREANRRIVFSLIVPDRPAEEPTTLEEIEAQTVPVDDATAAEDAAQDTPPAEDEAPANE